ncbi:hypothetical protein ACJRO7_025514 [Eucalyptus globulus]|uniref:Response regulatory domain-containing protein n=1 Tax=Eucalyptus globulus TaxID=34317 RepID=A0ABD3KD00_EUCGL
MGPSSDLAGSNDCESTSSNSVGDEGGCTWDELVLRNSMTALVVDGETESRLAVTEMLESAGVETEMVGSGQEGLNLTGKNYDLILVDRFVHDMSGLETIRRMRRRGVQTKIIGLTSRDIETDKAEIMNAGADGCLKKPVSADAMADILAEIDYEIDHR